LEIERKAEYRSEYLNGGMFAMAGASRNRGRIVVNAILQLGPQLRGGPCEVAAIDLRLLIKALSVYTYPDVMVTCGPDEYPDRAWDTVTNPKFIAEVLSDSTKNYDRGEKFRFYRTIPASPNICSSRRIRFAPNTIDGCPTGHGSFANSHPLKTG
jgi:Uma2 family endonuclease